MLYKKTIYRTNHLNGNDHFEGMSMEREMEICVNERRPIDRNAIQNTFYTRRKFGVLPETDIRTDRFEMAQTAMTKLSTDIKNNIIALHQQSGVVDVPDKSANP